MTSLPFDEDLGESAARPDPTGCPPFEVELPRTAPLLSSACCSGAVVKAADFGFSEASTDNIAAINAALAEARRTGAARVELAPGTYRCFDLGACAGVVLSGFSDFTFDGCGATLVFRRPPRLPIEPSWDHDGSGANFIVRNCRRTRIGNLNMDWDWRTMPLATCAKVVAAHIDEAEDNASFVDFELFGHGDRHPYFGKPFPVQHVQPMTDDFRHFLRGEHIWQGTYEGDMGCRTEWLSPTRVRVWPSVESPGLLRWRGPGEREFSPAENRRNAAAIPVGQSCRIAHAYYGKGGFTLFSNEDFELHDVEIRACFGHAVYVGGTQRNWRLRNVTVAPRDLRHPISSSADTVHFVRSCGNAVIDNLTVRLEQDDALNAHDRFTVARRIAPRTLEVVLKRGARYFRPGVGDAVELLDPGYNATGWTGVCTAAEGETVEVDRDLPETAPEEGYFLLLDRTASSDGLIVRNCTFEDMEMRVLVNVSNATIENCVFRRTNGDALRCIADYTLEWWAEGMGARNIVVRNCRFEENCVRELVGEYWSLGADFATWLGHPGEVAPQRLNRNYVSDILVEGCAFVDSLGYFADLRAGTNITFRNNRIERTGRRAECRETSGSARIEGASGVRFEDNEFYIPAGAPEPRVEILGARAEAPVLRRAGNGAEILRRAGNGAVVLKNNRLFRRAGWPGGTQATTNLRRKPGKETTMKSSIHWLATALCALAMSATGSAFGAPSEFTAETDQDNNGYNGTVYAGGDGYAFTAEDSARYYKFLHLYDDLLLDGAVCAGSTNWFTAYIGNHAWHPVTVTVTNGARMVTGKERNILFRGKGGTIVVSEPTDAPFEWGTGSKITTVIGDTYPNMIGTVGFTSKFTLCSDVTSDTGTDDILRLLAHGTASYQFISNQNANVAARILFEGGDLRSIYNDATKFQVADGAKIILQSVDGNPIILRSYAYSRYSLFEGAGTLETAGDGDVVLLQHSYAPAKTVMLGADEGGRIVWGNAGNFKLGGRMCLKLTSDDVLPHGEGKGRVMIAVGEYSGTTTSAADPLVIDLNGTANTVNGIGINSAHAYYSKWHVITNSSATVATLGLDIYADKNLHEIMTTNLADNAASSIRLKKIGAGKLSIGNVNATNILERVAGTEVADGVLWFGNNYTLTRPLTVSGTGSIQVREDVQYARTLNLSAIPDADLSIGGLTVDTAYYYGKTPTITKFRPAANGTLYLTNVSGNLPATYTVPINLTTVVDAENFDSWGVTVNGAPLKGAAVVYENGALKVSTQRATVIEFR